MTIATLRFTLADQRAFARLSGDFNPVHVDPVAARRVAAGEPIVHGMHLLLRALDARFKRGQAPGRCSVSARFQRPALLGESIQVEATAHDRLTLTLEGADPLVEVALGNKEAAADAEWPGSIRGARGRATTTPRIRAFADISSARGAIEFSDTPAIRRAFPHLARRLGGDTVAAMAGLSRLVGMECPGRDSLLSAVDLDVMPNAAASRLTWRVSKADERFGLIRLEVSSACIRGTVDAFLRPPPASMPTFASVAAQVAPGEFAGQRALIVGGSRGLGAATALIVASGGGAPLITFTTGTAEVAALQRDARRSGRRIEALRFDILNDPIARLAHASGRFGATHLYFFATPRIFARRREPFDAALFRRFAAFYVTGFADVCAAAHGSSPLDVFYPSSTALDQHVRELTEYSAAKAAGEMLCGMLQTTTPGLRILVRRLARVATDQTASLIPARALDPVTTMLPIVREMHRHGGGHS
jgi:NAD(P)-dependent dehydrogenase (short-subunit alcohol dehydrogenase family)